MNLTLSKQPISQFHRWSDFSQNSEFSILYQLHEVYTPSFRYRCLNSRIIISAIIYTVVRGYETSEYNSPNTSRMSRFVFDETALIGTSWPGKMIVFISSKIGISKIVFAG